MAMGQRAYLQTCFDAFLVESGVEQRLDDYANRRTFTLKHFREVSKYT